MADLATARRVAEQWLKIHDSIPYATGDNGEAEYVWIIRSLLAATEPAPGHDRISELESLLRECNAVCLCGCPDGEHEADECGESCGHDDHECIRVAPAVLEIVQRYRVALSKALAPQPAPALPEEVREAAERLFRAFGDVVPLYRNKSGTLHRPDETLPFGVSVAELIDEDGITGAGNDMIEFALLAMRVVLAARKGGA